MPACPKQPSSTSGEPAPANAWLVYKRKRKNKGRESTAGGRTNAGKISQGLLAQDGLCDEGVLVKVATSQEISHGKSEANVRWKVVPSLALALASTPLSTSKPYFISTMLNEDDDDDGRASSTRLSTADDGGGCGGRWDMERGGLEVGRVGNRSCQFLKVKYRCRRSSPPIIHFILFSGTTNSFVLSDHPRPVIRIGDHIFSHGRL